MSTNSKIEWTDHTWNPWEGCTKKSPGCKNCYAEARNKRFSAGANWGKGKPRRHTSESNWRLPLSWEKQTRRWPTPSPEVRRPRVFPSLCDWLDDEVPIEWLADFLALIQTTPNLDWLLLTKSPENWSDRLHHAFREDSTGDLDYVSPWLDGEPPPNVWLGVSVEDQIRADERIPVLLNIPARLRFLSCEPLLEPINLTQVGTVPINALNGNNRLDLGHVDWVITGGESGPGARLCNIEWLRGIITQCQAATVPVFVKQLGSQPFMTEFAIGHLRERGYTVWAPHEKWETVGEFMRRLGLSRHEAVHRYLDAWKARGHSIPVVLSPTQCLRELCSNPEFDAFCEGKKLR